MVFLLITLNFLIPRTMPGDPVDALLGQGATGFSMGEEARASLEEYYGLDGSLASQYGNYLSRLAQGDLGRSIATNAPVRQEILRKLPWTLLLIVSSLVLATAIGLVAGAHSGWHRDKPTDRALLTALIVVWEFPPYLFASLLLLVFAVKLRWLPLFGSQTPFTGLNLEWTLDVAEHLVLPLIVLTAGLAAYSYLVMRAGMVTELGSDHLLLGRAKGLRDRRLKYGYAARNALLPVVGLTAVELSSAVTANILVERAFSYPGLGGMIFGAIAVRDYPTLQGVFLVITVGVVTVNAAADALYRRLDPRTTA